MCLNDFKLTGNVVIFIFANLTMSHFVFMIILICITFLLTISHDLLLKRLIIKSDQFFITRTHDHNVVILSLRTYIIRKVKDSFHT